jgi:hypothetical protein
MATLAGTPDFGAIVLPVPRPLLYLGSFVHLILGNEALVDEEKAPLADVDG